MSINEPYITRVITLTLQKAFAGTDDRSIAETPYVAKLLVQAQHDVVDLFILLLNNMRLSGVTFLPEKQAWGDVVDLFILLLNNMRLSGVTFLPEKKPWGEALLEVITHLRDTYHKPVIGLPGLPPTDTWIEERITNKLGLAAC